MGKIELRKVDVIQYLQPLREGGSLPALVLADDNFHYVIKFRGAGQGKKALIAELIGGEMARILGLHVPEIVFMNLDESFSMTEGDEEIQDLLKFSVGLNLGLHFLSGAIMYDPLIPVADNLTASLVVLLDSIITNIDRTARNTNLLNWHNELWLIDHGASFYFHHNWPSWEDHMHRTFPMIKDHVLLSQANKLDDAANTVLEKLTSEKIGEIIDLIPEEWLEEKSNPFSPEEIRAAYKKFIITRVNNIELLVKEAKALRDER